MKVDASHVWMWIAAAAYGAVSAYVHAGGPTPVVGGISVLGVILVLLAQFQQSPQPPPPPPPSPLEKKEGAK